MVLGPEEAREATEELALGLSPGGGEASHGAIWGESIPGSGNSKGRSPEVGAGVSSKKVRTTQLFSKVGKGRQFMN